MLNVPRRAERGIALIITLILLSVTLVMALAFLAVSRRERSGVATSTDTTTARLAADSALAQAEAQIVSTMLASSNAFNYGLIVSTNFINANGFTPNYANPINVNYDYTSLGGALNGNDLLLNLANLYYSPRPPVFVTTNAAGATDFRYYLDLNRNGQFDASGVVTNYDSLGNVMVDSSGNVVTNFQNGDPQWIGVLERPDTTYGPDNKFLSRFAYICLPVGNALDVNYIYNQAYRPGPKQMTGADYLRNQGVGSWELNLAAFLNDLNTNTYAWGSTYNYDPFGVGDTGNAFIDALALYRYRLNGLFIGNNAVDYAYNTSVLNSVNNLFGPAGNIAFANDLIDEYADGPLQTAPGLPFDNDGVDQTYPWPGADTTNHFFTPQEFFDPVKVSAGFTNRLALAQSGNGAANVSTYDRYTYYRMLAQLGTDSTPESGKMNLNYDNLDPGFNGALNVNGTASVTNFVPWTALNFFTNAADRMLKLYTTNWFESNPSNYLATYYGINYNYYHLDAYGNTVTNDPTGYGLTNIPYFGVTNTIPAFGVANIPVQVNGSFVYSPAVNRVLQLAANIYDASTNDFYPSVFRPIFMHTNGNIFASGYEQVVLNGVTPYLATPTNVEALLSFNPSTDIHQNVYGVPWIIGARKGFPSFSQLYMVNTVEVTRKLEVTRTSAALPLNFSTYATNQWYEISISNNVGISFWNSYSNNYPNALTVYANNSVQMVLTNGVNTWVSNIDYTIPSVTINSWPGSQWGASRTLPPLGVANPNSFYSTSWTSDFIPQSVYRFSSASFIPTWQNPPWETSLAPYPLPPLPQFGLLTTNRLQAYILDGTHVVDYVQLRGPINNANLNQEIADPNYVDPFNPNVRYQWSTNTYSAPNPMTTGVYNQLAVSGNPSLAPGNSWVRPPGMPSTLYSSIPGAAEAAFFNGFFTPTFQFGGINYTNTQLSIQAPYTPTRLTYDYILWQVNDPLVHYLGSDLNYSDPGTTGWHNNDKLQGPTIASQTAPGKRYQPWGLNKQMAGLVNVDTNAYNTADRDPLIWSPENWDFPANKYPAVGWLGRVHRGTPWQTVYLKASNLLNENNGTNTWAQWTGDTQLNGGQYYDAANAAPLQDRLLFDLFTTAPNDNATRGQLSVNVGAPDGPSLAAWSAVFSGLVTLSNNVPNPGPSYTTAPSTTWTNIINPAGVDAVDSPLWQIVTNINVTRSQFPFGTFKHVGDILSAPLLTEQSPFLNRKAVSTVNPPLKNGISDEMYEWLPQQTLSLLRADNTPRYVIYSYGQTLTPAPGSVVTSGTYFGMITNYAVVAETATRTVVRVENAGTTHPHIVVESFNVLPPD